MQVSLLCGVLAFSLSTIPGVRIHPGFDVVVDGWLQGGCYVLAAMLALLKPFQAGAARRVWIWFGAALAARAAAFVLYFSIIRYLHPTPYPSIADAGWLAMCVLALAGLVQLSRAEFSRLPVSLALDGLMGALAVAAAAVAFLRGTLSARSAAGGGSAKLVTNLAYPILDIALLVVLIGLMLAYRWRPPPAVLALAAGVAGFAINDIIFLYQITAGTFRPGTALSALSLLATAVIATAPWLPARVNGPHSRDALPGLLFPGAFALLCLAILVLATSRPLPLLSVVLSSFGVAVAIARTGLSFHAVRTVAEHRREARTDELTGLPNRRAFNEAFSAALENRAASHRLALMVLDLDNFKAVNDSLGHHHGDELLSMVAARLQPALRGGDLFARIGGDEFAVLLDDAGAELASQIAERLRAALRRPFDVSTGPLQIGVSVGIALFPDNAVEPVALLQRADLAMYDAKANDSGQSLFSRVQHQPGQQRIDEANALRRAIEGNELVLHYQPQFSMDTGSLVGVEALVRWQRPGVGLLQPAAFLPQAASGGLLRLLTLNVLTQAITQAAVWRAQGRHLTVAVNMSVADLLDLDFPNQVGALLQESGLPGRCLELELTEDLFMADPGRAGKVLGALLELGVALVVDDYGTGYSSLGYLRDLRELRGLKLDRSFVTRMDVDPRAEAIVDSTIRLARALGLRVVAEGVETEAVRWRLAEMGCPFAQGFLYSRPVPPDQISFTAGSEIPGKV